MRNDRLLANLDDSVMYRMAEMMPAQSAAALMSTSRRMRGAMAPRVRRARDTAVRVSRGWASAPTRSTMPDRIVTDVLRLAMAATERDASDVARQRGWKKLDSGSFAKRFNANYAVKVDRNGRFDVGCEVYTPASKYRKPMGAGTGMGFDGIVSFDVSLHGTSFDVYAELGSVEAGRRVDALVQTVMERLPALQSRMVVEHARQ